LGLIIIAKIFLVAAVLMVLNLVASN